MSRRRGLIARADNGGLGHLTWELARHVDFDRIVVVDLDDAGRGPLFLDRYDGDVFVSPFPLSDDAVEWLVDGCDVVYTAEIGYRPDLFARLRAADVRSVLHLMPELYAADNGGDDDPDLLVTPTTWVLDRLPERTHVLPVPVALDRFEQRHVESVETLLHVTAPAMLDRNGTLAVLSALSRIESDCRLVVAGNGSTANLPSRVGHVDVEIRGPVDEYWRLYDDVDALVLPRRYGGLSLPMNEAAAAGLPIVTTDLSPQNDWTDPALRVATLGSKSVRMKGGRYDVFEPDPTALAATVDLLVSDPDVAASASERSSMYAGVKSWPNWQPTYESWLDSETIDHVRRSAE